MLLRRLKTLRLFSDLSLDLPYFPLEKPFRLVPVFNNAERRQRSNQDLLNRDHAYREDHHAKNHLDEREPFLAAAPEHS